jgi:hypothetical protein
MTQEERLPDHFNCYPQDSRNNCGPHEHLLETGRRWLAYLLKEEEEEKEKFPAVKTW